MAKDIYIFKRIEKKYIVSADTKNKLLNEIEQYLIPDSHGKSTVCSLYLDTPDFLLIRNSIDAKCYKEKLRMRCYGTPKADDKVFLEIKKKFKGVVYKRRVPMTLCQAKKYVSDRIKPLQSQIMNEIDYAMDFYNSPAPSMLIAYEREAYYAKDAPNVRLTFDYNVRYRNDDLYLEHGNVGTKIIPDGTYILEIKTDGAMPLWLAQALTKLEIFPHSFSKYGTAYKTELKNTNKEALTV